MRFPADDIHKVRAGEKTRLTIPPERNEDGGGYKRAPFKVANYYRIEKLVDVGEQKNCGRCKRRGRLLNGDICEKCMGRGTYVTYTTRVERIEGSERVQVHSVTKLRPHDMTDEMALEEGWESADEWRDVFFCDFGEVDWCWTVTFELTDQVPQYMANQHGIMHPPQYVSTPERALDDADAPTADEYRAWSEKSEEDARRQREIKRLEDRRRALDDKLDHLRRKAA